LIEQIDYLRSGQNFLVRTPCVFQGNLRKQSIKAGYLQYSGASGFLQGQPNLYNLKVMTINKNIFREYGMRGIAGSELGKKIFLKIDTMIG